MLGICNTKSSLKPHLYSSSFGLWNQITENPLLLSQFLCIPTVVIPLHTMLRIYTYIYIWVYLHARVLTEISPFFTKYLFCLFGTPFKKQIKVTHI